MIDSKKKKVKTLGYLRSCDNEIAICAPSCSGGAVLSDSGGIVLRFLRGDNPAQIAKEFATRFNNRVTECEIEADLIGIGNELICAGLCTEDDAEANGKQQSGSEQLLQSERGKVCRNPIEVKKAIKFLDELYDGSVYGYESYRHNMGRSN